MPHVVVIDNYDSFTYNLVQAFRVRGARVSVVRNDQLDMKGLQALRPERLVISPGPGGPDGTGISGPALMQFRDLIPVLGVCLGHQLLAACLGGKVVRAAQPVHGKRGWIHHDGSGIFSGLPQPFLAARYHSLIVDRGTLPAELRVTAWTDQNEIMAVGIPGEATWGVQFHPESFMTPSGGRLLGSFLGGERCREAE